MEGKRDLYCHVQVVFHFLGDILISKGSKTEAER